MGQYLGSFQPRFVQRITGRQPRRQEEGGWYYPPMEIAMKEAEFEDIKV